MSTTAKARKVPMPTKTTHMKARQDKPYIMKKICSGPTSVKGKILKK